MISFLVGCNGARARGKLPLIKIWGEKRVTETLYTECIKDSRCIEAHTAGRRELDSDNASEASR